MKLLVMGSIPKNIFLKTIRRDLVCWSAEGRLDKLSRLSGLAHRDLSRSIVAPYLVV